MTDNKLKQISNSGNHHNTIQNRQLYILRKLILKLVTENAILVQADNGKTIVIINSDEYSKKVHTILTDNFHFLKNAPTGKYEELIQKTLNNAT
jgi:hypothetical protein